jgi:exopolysaccharide biosynthesis predicted pyruvyltransferase EpsI
MGQLKTNHFKLITLFLCLGLLSDFMVMAKGFRSENTPEIYTENEELKIAAFEVLDTHCNSCHIEKNPKKVFSLDNMNGFAKNINRQVFVFKRMPKGKERREDISAEEMRTLKKWVNETLN